nr:8954_t:CDS:2 [Entrophospora candida]CAG8451761.1 14490_t:CDS:2 [Entrophospora candida]
MSDQLKEFVEMPKQFIKEGTQFVNRCTKPDRKAVAMGFFVMGFIGFFVKLVHIPINNILVGGA